MMFDIVTAGIFLWRARAIFIRGSFVIGMQDENVIEKWREIYSELMPAAQRWMSTTLSMHNSLHWNLSVSHRNTPTTLPTLSKHSFEAKSIPIHSANQFSFSINEYLFYVRDWLCAVCTWQHTRWQIGELRFRFCTQMAVAADGVCVPTVSTFRTVFVTLSTHFGRYAVPFRLTMQQLNE